MERASGALARAKPKDFPSFLMYFGGGWGEPTKNGKEIFGFCFAASVSEKSNLIMTLLFALFYIFAATRGAYNSVCAKAQSNLIVLAPPAQCARKSSPF